MTHSLHLVLRCDVWSETRPHTGDTSSTRGTRCPAYWIGRPHHNIAEVRATAAQDGWTFKRGQPYEHIGASDYCPEHKQ